jgi:hypothetical protein
MPPRKARRGPAGIKRGAKKLECTARRPGISPLPKCGGASDRKSEWSVSRGRSVHASDGLLRNKVEMLVGETLHDTRSRKIGEVITDSDRGAEIARCALSHGRKAETRSPSPFSLHWVLRAWRRRLKAAVRATQPSDQAFRRECPANRQTARTPTKAPNSAAEFGSGELESGAPRGLLNSIS